MRKARSVSAVSLATMLGILLGLPGAVSAQPQTSAVSPEGFSIGVTAGMMTSSAAYNNGTINAEGLGRSLGTSAINADYTFRGMGVGTLTLGVDYDLSNRQLASYRDASNNFGFKQDRRYGLYFSPGVLLGNNAIGYLRIGYSWLDVDGQGDRSGQSYEFQGWNYGLGTRVFLDKNVYLSLEWIQSNYGSERLPGSASLKPESTAGVLGVGYKF